MPTAAAAPMLPLLSAAAQRHGLPPSLLYAVAEAESNFNPSAYRAEPQINDASYGLMQLLTRTARALGFEGDPVRLFDPYVSAELGARLLRDHIDRVTAAHPELGGGEVLARAVSVYNAGWSDQRPADGKRDSSGQFVNRDYVAKVSRLADLWERIPKVGAGLLGAAAVVGLALVVLRSIARQINREGFN